MAAVLVLSACSIVRPAPESPNSSADASGEPAQPSDSVAESVSSGTQIARVAAELVGAPYHFGGADLQGFDCSGLAVYAHQQVGLEIPRTAQEQKRAARPVSLDSLEPGDLVFFRIRARHVNHVGIYAGAGRFIHAPRSGGVVSYGELGGDYYRKHLAGAGRFWRDEGLAHPGPAPYQPPEAEASSPR
jgi:cell wall-associated NlpC family hydrolase